MKQTTIILLALLGGGCAAAHPVATKQQPLAPVTDSRPASALCFASAVAPSFPLPGLDRTDREPSAFLGYDQTITESFFIFTDDDQMDLLGLDSFQREAVYAKTGTRTR